MFKYGDLQSNALESTAQVNWMCSACGEDPSCDCKAPLVSNAQRAAEAIARDPNKSDGAIAAETGITISRAREKAAHGM